jgi:hypothetical protein
MLPISYKHLHGHLLLNAQHVTPACLAEPGRPLFAQGGTLAAVRCSPPVLACAAMPARLERVSKTSLSPHLCSGCAED